MIPTCGPTAGATGGTVKSRTATFVFVVGLALAAGFFSRRLSVFGAPATSESEVADLRQRVAALASARGTDGENGTAPSVRSLPGDGRQTEQSRRIEALEANVAAALKQLADDAAAAAGTESDDESDADRELRRLRELATPALLEEIRRLVRPQRETNDEQTSRNEKAIQACDVFLGRKIEAPQRAEVLTIKGITWRETGDFDKAEATFREALGLVSPTSKEGLSAAAQIAFNAALRHDTRSAADQFLAIALRPGVAAETRAQFRCRAANFYAASRDLARAREEHRAVVDEFGASDDKNARAFADESRKEIEKLDRGANVR